MFRFERCATVRNAADIPAAVQFATEVTAYLNKQHSLNMKFGIEIFGAPCVQWYFDDESERSLAERPRLSGYARQGQEHMARGKHEGQRCRLVLR